jgi:hypothetical protein
VLATGLVAIQVDIGGLTDDLSEMVDEALRPALSSLWLRAR